jgi:bacterioferritin-associated ferredoxin
MTFILTAMITCLCHDVSEQQVARHAREGARTVEEVGRRCGAGTDCGTCREEIDAILARTHAHEPPARPFLLAIGTPAFAT